MSTLQLLAIVVYLGMLFYTIKQIDFIFLLANKQLQHIIFGATAAVFTLWIFRTGIYDGLSVHFLWLPALALTLGLRWAIISASVALLGTTAFGYEDWAMIGVNGLLGVVIPLCFSYAILMLVFHKLTKHLFVYIFVCAFLPGALTMALKMALISGYYTLDGIYTWRVVYDNYFILTPLMLFPEAMFNGMTITLLAIHKPQWLYTYNDKFYLDK